MLLAASVGTATALLIAGAGGALGSIVGGLITLKVTREQIRAETRRQWRSIAADAYATTLAVSGAFNPQSADAAAQHLQSTGQLPESYSLNRARASEALRDLARTSVLSDNSQLKDAVDKLSDALRLLDRTWGDLIDWRVRLSTYTSTKSAVYKNVEQLVHGLNMKLDGLLSDIYGTGGKPGLLPEMKNALDASNRPAWWHFLKVRKGSRGDGGLPQRSG